MPCLEVESIYVQVKLAPAPKETALEKNHILYVYGCPNGILVREK